MKLMTATNEYQGYRTPSALPETVVDVEGTLNELRHDAAAAHALMQAMREWSDGHRDGIEQLAFRWTLLRADELMRAWGFEPEAGK